MADIIVCCAQKGGCAKTVTTHNLAYALSRMGRRVLTVDLDTQANLTTCFGIDDPASLPVSIADRLVIPVNPQYLSTTGLNALIGTIRKVRHRFNRNLEVAGILLTMCDNRTNLCRILSEQIREEYQAYMPIFEAAVPMTVKVGEAVYYSRSVVEYAPNSSAAVAYRKAAEELDAKSGRLRLLKKTPDEAAGPVRRKGVSAI